MSLDRIHRRLCVALSLAALLAFVGGAGVEPVSALLAGTVLLVALVRAPGRAVAEGVERILGPLAAFLVLRALLYVLVLGGDVVVPVVDLLLLLLAGECLRPADSTNEVRIYALSFALVLAATAYRPGVIFALAFTVYVVLASLTVPTGLLRRKARQHGIREVPLDRGFVLTNLTLSLVTLGVATLVFLTFPRVSRAWPGRGEVMATSVAGFSDRISLGEHGARIYSNPEIVLRVEFPDGLPDDPLGLHWRGRSYDRFDGFQWTRSSGVRPSAAPSHWYTERWPGPLVRQRVFAAPLEVRVLFALHPVVDLDTRRGIEGMRDNVGDLSYWGSAAPTYEAVSVDGRPTADSLRAASGGFMPDRSRYLQLPRLPDRIAALADSLTRDFDNRYDRAVAVERYLRGNYAYTRELPRSAAETSLDHFLFARRAGHCEYFSSAMVVLLRSVGIHARNVNGFLGGRWNQLGSYMAVTQNEAHSWVEVWFPGYGWVPFDPTPGGSGGGGAAESWLWPGRLFFDGLQHRWSKWVLDYSLTDQVEALGRLSRLLERPEPEPGAAGDGRRLPVLVWVLPLAAMLLLGVWWARRRHRPTRPETALYLELVRLARRRGVTAGHNVTPLRLAGRLAARVPDAASDVHRFVQRYLEARFARRELTPAEHEEMRTLLEGLRRAFR